MNNLIILTTATPRPELHAIGLLETIEVLIKERTQNKIYWYVNIDKPKMFNKQEVKQTINQINNFAKEKTEELSVFIFSDHKEAHAGAAARRLYTEIAKSRPFEQGNEVFFWFEDDWALTNKGSFVKAVGNFFETSQDVLLCTWQKYISGHPFLFRRDFFDVITDKYKVVKRNTDPELFLFDCVKDYYMTSLKRLKQPLYNQKNLFEDIGRKWREDRSIGKTNKYEAKQHNFTWFLE